MIVQQISICRYEMLKNLIPNNIFQEQCVHSRNPSSSQEYFTYTQMGPHQGICHESTSFGKCLFFVLWDRLLSAAFVKIIQMGPHQGIGHESTSFGNGYWVGAGSTLLYCIPICFFIQSTFTDLLKNSNKENDWYEGMFFHIHGLLYKWTELLYLTCPHEADLLTLIMSQKLTQYL